MVKESGCQRWWPSGSRVARGGRRHRGRCAAIWVLKLDIFKVWFRVARVFDSLERLRLGGEV